MNQKQIGIILIIISIILTIVVFSIKSNEDKIIRKIVDERGSCFLEDGTCLHQDRDLTFYIAGWVISGALLLLGLYLAFVDKTQQVLTEHQVKVSSALKEASKKDEFNAFLGAFTEDEKAVLKSIKEQDGILQSTLRYKAGISKAGISLMLKSLEERGIISKKVKGKSNQVFLRKKF